LNKIILILLSLILFGCSATGPVWVPQKLADPSGALVVVYRYSQVGGGGGSWVSAKLQVNTNIIRKIPDNSFVAISVPVGDISLSATPKLNLHYSSEHELKLIDKVSKGETAYFRLVSVFGSSCSVINSNIANGEIASITYHPWSGGNQTTCFQRVPEAIALEELHKLRRAE